MIPLKDSGRVKAYGDRKWESKVFIIHFMSSFAVHCRRKRNAWGNGFHASITARFRYRAVEAMLTLGRVMSAK
jgi:hypothetical protein